MTTTLVEKIKHRLSKKGRGWCFTPSDFLDLGNYDAIRQVLTRLTSVGLIKRIAHGLYSYPRQHEVLGELPPSLDSIIKAIQVNLHIKCQPSGAYAANLLGLSEQVPAKIVLLTDGATKNYKIGNKEITFKKTVPKNMATAGTMTSLIIQSIKYLGKDHLSKRHYLHIRNQLAKKDVEHLKRHYHLAPAWIAKIIKNEILADSS